MKYSDLPNRTIKNIVEQTASGNLKLVDILDSVYSMLERQDRDINSFITHTKDRSYARAEKLQQKLDSKSRPGALFGVPVAIKDNICIKGVRTTCGSKMLENYFAPYSADVIERLEAEDALIIGKTNMDEFAMGSSTETSYFGPTKNPHDTARIPGGSSGGSAASVAAGFVPVSLGSDTGGSIRQPAALCGVYGLKPTYGLVSRFGLVAFASSLDQIGPFATSVEDLAIMLEAISGYDPRDSTSVKDPRPRYSKELDINAKEMVIGIPEEYFIPGIQKDVLDRITAVIGSIENAGVRIKKISLPHTKYSIAAYYIIAPSEASANLARYDGVKYGYRAGLDDGVHPADLSEVYSLTRSLGFGSEVKRRIMLGTYSLSSGYYDAYYLKAQKVRTLIKQDFEKAFQECDLILTPTTPETAFKMGEKTGDPLKMYLSDIFTISCNMAGIPGLSMPVGLDSQKLPIGLQLLGKPFGERELLGFARFIEQLIGREFSA